MAKNKSRKPCKKTEAVHLRRPQPVKATGTFTQMLEKDVTDVGGDLVLRAYCQRGDH